MPRKTDCVVFIGAKMTTPRNNTRKKSIWAGPPIEQFAARRQVVNLSGALNTAIGRYEYMLSESLPTLSWREWAIIFRALETVVWGSALPAAHLSWAIVADYQARPGNYPAIDAAEQATLAKKMREMPASALVAIVDKTEQFWSGPYEFPTEQVIREVVPPTALSE